MGKKTVSGIEEICDLIENSFSVLKPKYSLLQAKLHFMKKREMGWRVLTYNLERLTKLPKKASPYLEQILTRYRHFSQKFITE